MNWEKCKFSVTELDFLGHHISQNGISPSQAKIDSVLSFRKPTTEAEVRSFLGLANYMNKYIPNLATMAEPLRKLIQKNVSFEWGQTQNESFETIKNALAAATKLGFFNPKDHTAVMADASPSGLGAVLTQTNSLGESRIICNASKSLTDTERRYCQTEKEALALVWSVERFRMYLYGREFDLITDCKALEFLFTPRSKPCARIERWVLRLQAFDYHIVHIPGYQNVADALSRLGSLKPIPFDADEELCIREVAETAAASFALKWERIEEESRKDREIMELIQMIQNDDQDSLPLSYKVISNELCIVGDVLLRVDRVIIPKILREHVLRLAHEGHPGMRMMKSHLRTNVWWPQMDQQVEMFVRQCKGCALVAAPNPPEPVIRKELPVQPWLDVAADFLGPLPEGQYLLVVIDYYSRFMEVSEMHSITANDTISELAIIFSRYGLPMTLRVDNGPQLNENCEEFREFCEAHGIRLVNTIPFWPAMNGEVERQNRSLLKRLRIAQQLGKDWRVEMRQYLLTYHSTAHTTTGKSPAELMLGRKIRTKLPQVPPCRMEDEEIRDRDTIMKEKGRIYADAKRKAKESDIREGDRVIAKRMRKDNKLDTPFSPEEFQVIKKTGADTVIRSFETGKQYRRNVVHLKRLESAEVANSSVDMNKETQKESDTMGESSRRETATVPTESATEDLQVRKTSRERGEPKRFKDFIPY